MGSWTVLLVLLAFSCGYIQQRGNWRLGIEVKCRGLGPSFHVVCLRGWVSSHAAPEQHSRMQKQKPQSFLKPQLEGQIMSLPPYSLVLTKSQASPNSRSGENRLSLLKEARVFIGTVSGILRGSKLHYPKRCVKAFNIH